MTNRTVACYHLHFKKSPQMLRHICAHTHTHTHKIVSDRLSRFNQLPLERRTEQLGHNDGRKTNILCKIIFLPSFCSFEFYIIDLLFLV